VTVSDATSPHRFSCQLVSNSLALELLNANMNECYQSTSGRHAQRCDADGGYDPSDENTSELYLDVTASDDGSRHTGDLERPLGVHQGDPGDDTAVVEEPVTTATSATDHEIEDDEMLEMMLTFDQLKSGLCCAALFHGDSCWYRAKVKSVDDEAVQVVFVDYGTEASVGIGELRWLKERFTSTKMMSFECSLEGWDEVNSTDAVEEFQQLVLNRKLIADVQSSAADEYGGLRYVVKLLDMGLSVGDRLKNPDDYKPVSVCVTSATSPHDFWCRCVDSASTAELPLLMDRIADLYRDDQNVVGSDLDLNDDDALYAAKYSDDVWYRARVISSHQSSTPATVDVIFVDYGTKTEVLASDLRPLPDDCRTLPQQAVHCRLSGVEPSTGGVWDDASMNRFVELVMCTNDERSLRLHPVNVAYNAEGDIVELCGRLLDGDNDIGAQLVHSGYAVDVGPGGGPNVQCRRRSSALSEERCNLFVSFDASTDATDEVMFHEAPDAGQMMSDAVEKLTGDDMVAEAAGDDDDEDGMDDEFAEAVESLGKFLPNVVALDVFSGVCLFVCLFVCLSTR